MRKMSYSDPPYPGQARRHYKNDPSGIPAAEVDHKELIERLLREYDAWSLSTNEPGLEHIKDLFPKGFFKKNKIRIGVWIKPWCSWKPWYTVAFAVEFVLFTTVRVKGQRPTPRNYLIANATKGKGTHGAKPPEFNSWVLDLMGYQPGDVLDDLYPGSGGMAEEIKRRCG